MIDQIPFKFLLVDVVPSIVLMIVITIISYLYNRSKKQEYDLAAQSSAINTLHEGLKRLDNEMKSYMSFIDQRLRTMGHYTQPRPVGRPKKYHKHHYQKQETHYTDKNGNTTASKDFVGE